jgi:hypothetical protein
VCPIAKGRACTVAELEECGIIPPPPAECGNGVVEPPLETCEPGVADDNCPGDCDPTTCTCDRH